jgi:hypothetical protein
MPVFNRTLDQLFFLVTKEKIPEDGTPYNHQRANSEDELPG